MHHKQFFDQEVTQKECNMMESMYVQASVDSLNERFLDLLVFNASIFFSPKYYPSDEEVRKTMWKQ